MLDAVKHNLLRFALFLTPALMAGCGRNVHDIAKEMAEDQTFIHDSLTSYLGESSIYAFAFILLAFGVAYGFYIMERNRWNGFWHVLEHYLYLLFVGSWTFGFCVYAVGMYIVDGGGTLGSSNSFWHFLGIAPMAVIHAFEMFLLESDISAVHESWHNNVFYMTLFSTSHFLAAFVSMIFVIKHFGYNIVAGVRLWVVTHIYSRRCEVLYVFWGMNEPSYLLARDIENKKLDNARTIFVKTADEGEATSERTAINRLFNFLSMKNKELDKFKDLHCFSTHAFYRLSKVEAKSEAQKIGRRPHLLKEILGLRSLVRLIDSTAKEVHVFMLGDDEDSNIKAAANLCRDADIVRATETKMVKVYCHARHDSIKRVVEDTNYTTHNLDVRILDSASMAIELLKFDKESPSLPVHFVDVEEDGTVSSAFRSMVIGMGQCGRDAIKFLYEHGSFVSSQRDEQGHIQPAPFTCDVFDMQMDRIGNVFKSSRPALSVSGVYEELPISDDHDIRLYHADSESALFGEFIEGHIKDENVVFITTKDDEAGIALAVRLLKLAIRKGNDLKRFRIFVRSYSHELLPHIEDIANFYNQAVAESLGLKDNPRPICIFGRLKDVYTYDNIIDESIRKESFRYYNRYNKKMETDGELGNEWNARREKEMSGNSGKYWNLNSVRRKEMQDIENALHRNTKIELMRKALGNNEARLVDLASRIANGSMLRNGVNLYARGPRYQALLDTLAQTEHLRWNASHRLLGYTHGAKKDEIRFTHNCLTGWENLDSDETRGYDYDVVETTLCMYMIEHNNNRSN